MIDLHDLEDDVDVPAVNDVEADSRPRQSLKRLVKASGSTQVAVEKPYVNIETPENEGKLPLSAGPGDPDADDAADAKVCPLDLPLKKTKLVSTVYE
jgi:benzoyl-CoA reductase/2-hydroxyglutaryl-CoA dehydratase subunit BcrC/BadD/HgdB